MLGNMINLKVGKGGGMPVPGGQVWNTDSLYLQVITMRKSGTMKTAMCFLTCIYTMSSAPLYLENHSFQKVDPEPRGRSLCGQCQCHFVRIQITINGYNNQSNLGVTFPMLAKRLLTRSRTFMVWESGTGLG
jgi:hypothetical protein